MCGTLALLTGTGVTVPGLVALDWSNFTINDLGPLFVPFYLVMWLAYSVVYLAWTHAVYTRRSPRGLVRLARQELSERNSRWARFTGSSGATASTLSGATIAIVLTLAIAQSPVYRTEIAYVVGGLLAVGGSWLLMVFAFALEYLHLDVVPQPDGTRHLVHAAEGPPEFGDYLTFTVLLSVMAATTSAEIRSRRAWRTVRLNVLFAFVFNSVIVAMMVSLLFGGLTS
ncbi:DUF1345 domain-containing protein [Propionibacteriaceae bacterium Y2011]